MIRSFDPAHAAVAYNVVAVPGLAPFVHAGDERQRHAGGDTPARTVLRVEVDQDAVTASAGAVEHQPLVPGARADDDGVPASDLVRDVGDRGRVQVGLPAPPGSDSLQEIQFSPRNMSRSVPIGRMAGSQ